MRRTIHKPQVVCGLLLWTLRELDNLEDRLFGDR